MAPGTAQSDERRRSRPWLNCPRGLVKGQLIGSEDSVQGSLQGHPLAGQAPGPLQDQAQRLISLSTSGLATREPCPA